MLDNILHLTPDSVSRQNFEAQTICTLAPSNPAIMIPGISDDGSLFPIEKIEAHIKGIHHLALSVFIFDGDELLIQRRADCKYHCGGQWANTCCTHPHMEENINDAAARRLYEELGIVINVEPKQIVEYSADVGSGLWERERVHIFRAEANKNTLKYNLNPEEVAEIRWIKAKDLHQEILNTPDKFTPWLRIYLNKFPELKF